MLTCQTRTIEEYNVFEFVWINWATPPYTSQGLRMKIMSLSSKPFYVRVSYRGLTGFVANKWNLLNIFEEGTNTDGRYPSNRPKKLDGACSKRTTVFVTGGNITRL